MARTPVLAGNWKMFKTVPETVEFFEAFKGLVADAADREIVLCPSFTSLAPAAWAVRGTNIRIGAQNVYWEAEGAFTGEISAGMLVGAGCSHVIIGHSERRQYFGETDATVAKRIDAALGAGLTPIVCVGETLEEREAGRTNEVLETQFSGGYANLTPETFAKTIIAYEPVWAIGTGKTATPEMAAEAHGFLRGQVASKFGQGAADGIRILYGGSVKPANVKGLMEKEDIDGGLVGGASLTADSFAAIVHFDR